MPDQVRHDRIKNLVSTVSVVVGLSNGLLWMQLKLSPFWNLNEIVHFSKVSIKEGLMLGIRLEDVKTNYEGELAKKRFYPTKGLRRSVSFFHRWSSRVGYSML
jgi:hypothetical protein